MRQRNEIFILCCCNRPQKYKGQNRPPEIRLSGVPPIVPIKTKKTQTKTTRLNRPSQIRLTGVPPIMHNIYIKNKKTSNKTLRNTFIRDPPSNAYKNHLKIIIIKSQNRPSDIRLAGVPHPRMPIIKKNQNRPS